MHVKPIRLLGDKVAIEFLPIKGTGMIEIPDTAINTEKAREALVWYIGSICSEPNIKVGTKVLVKTYTGATPIRHNDIILRLYNTEDVIAVLV